MRISGLSTLLLLVLSVIIVLLAVSGMPGGLGELWDRATGGSPPIPTEQQDQMAPRPLDARPMNTQDGMRQMDRMQRDMAQVDSLAGSVRNR